MIWWNIPYQTTLAGFCQRRMIMLCFCSLFSRARWRAFAALVLMFAPTGCAAAKAQPAEKAAAKFCEELILSYTFLLCA
jgi:hypothetical protein